MCEPYRRLVADPQAVFSLLSPSSHSGGANCPETADAMHDFLDGDEGRRVRSDSGIASFRFSRRTSWSRRISNLEAAARRLRDCTHIVVRGHRGAGTQYTPEHFFVVLKFRGVVYVADAYTREFTRGVQVYLNREAPLDRMTSFEFARIYDVTVEDPLAAGADPLLGL